MGRRGRRQDVGLLHLVGITLVRWFWFPALGGAVGFWLGGPMMALFAFIALIVGIGLALTILDFLV